MSELSGVSSSYPLPPSLYISSYSDELFRKGRSPLPPPPPPLHDTYSMFGTPCHADDAIIRPLESQGIRRLYPQNLDHRRELKKLNHSIFVNYLDLLEILILSPDSSKRQDKIDDISLLFIHLHHLINEFRPHQARETLRVMLEVQKRSTYETVERFGIHLEKTVQIVRSALESLPTPLNENTTSNHLVLPHSASIGNSIPNTSSTVVEHEQELRMRVEETDTMMCEIADNL